MAEARHAAAAQPELAEGLSRVTAVGETRLGETGLGKTRLGETNPAAFGRATRCLGSVVTVPGGTSQSTRTRGTIQSSGSLTPA